jgi:hypothetical protein
MSVKIEYSCDLCREKISDLTKLKCVYWDSTAKNLVGTFGRYTLITNCKSSDRHICDDCIMLIKDISSPPLFKDNHA